MSAARRIRTTVAVATLALAATASTARGAEAPTVYALANGCYTLTDASGQALPVAQSVRMQATTLGSYLLYRPDHTFVTAQPDGSLAPATEPSPAADWQVEEAGAGNFTLTPREGPALSGVRFVAADGCAI